MDFTGLAITQGSPRTIYGSTGGRGIWQFTESNGGSLSDIKLTESELAHHIPGLPFHTFLPYTTKNRLNGTC